MRLFARGRWLQDQKRWSVVIPLPEKSVTSNLEEGQPRKEPLKRQAAKILRLRKRTTKP